MSRLSLSEAPRAIQSKVQSKASLMGVAALFYLSGALETEAEPAQSQEQPTTQQAPAPQQPPAPAPQQTPAGQTTTPPAQPPAAGGAAPAADGPKADVPLPTVQVQGNRPQAPRRPQVAAQPARQAPPAPPPPAPATDVNAAASTAGTAGTGGYLATTPSLSRLPTPILNTPQTVNVVTQQVIQEQVSSTVRDALRNVAGVTFRAGEGGNQGDTPYIRGFSAQSDVFRDGVRDPGWYTRDTFARDEV